MKEVSSIKHPRHTGGLEGPLAQSFTGIVTDEPMWPPQGDQHPQRWLPVMNASSKVIQPAARRAVRNPESEVMRRGNSPHSKIATVIKS